MVWTYSFIIFGLVTEFIIDKHIFSKKGQEKDKVITDKNENQNLFADLKIDEQKVEYPTEKPQNLLKKNTDKIKQSQNDDVYIYYKF